MTSFQLALIYTDSAALEILEGIALEVTQIKPLRRKAVVSYKTRYGKGATFISSRKFAQNFVDRRRSAAKGLKVDEITYEMYRVNNPEGDRSYVVQLLSSGAVQCECHDYRNQVDRLGEGCCKHAYAVVCGWFGFSSLRDYQKIKQAVSN
jgi:hypothetical protein